LNHLAAKPRPFTAQLQTPRFAGRIFAQVAQVCQGVSPWGLGCFPLGSYGAEGKTWEHYFQKKLDEVGFIQQKKQWPKMVQGFVGCETILGFAEGCG
jgi:hypothetical protein